MLLRAQRALLEREGELAEIEVALEGVRGGCGRLVAVEGTAGIGKTRLLEEARNAATEAGMRVLTARGTELEREFPFALVRQLFESELRALDSGRRDDLLAGAARPAGPVVGVGEPAGAGEVLEDPSFATLNALYWLISNLAEDGPTLLAVDDAHWSDLPSLRFFRFMAPRLEDVPVLLALAARPAEPGAAALVGELLADPAATVIRPRALSRAAVTEVVAADLGSAHEDFSAACHEATGGNPFMLRELVRELVADGTAGTAGDAPHVREVAPASIQRAVLVRLARLSADAQDLARSVAVLGDDVALPDAAELADLDRGPDATAADALVLAGILEAGRPLRFVHPLLRTAVYADMTGAVKVAAHARAARMLDERGAEPERIATHLLGTEPAGDPHVVAVLRAAALRTLDRAAPETAAAYLRRALAEPAAPDVRPELLRLLIRAYFRAGDREAFERLLEAEPFEALFTEPQLLMDSALEFAHLLYNWGRLQEMEALLEAATAAAIDVGERGRAAFFQGILGFWKHLPPAVQLAGIEARREWIEPDTPAERMCLGLEANWRLLTGGTREVVVDLARRALADGKIWRENSDNPAPGAVTYVLRTVDDLDFAERATEQRVMSTGAWATTSSAWERGELAYLRGNVAEAEALARSAMQITRQAGFPLAFPLWLTLLVEVLIDRDDLAGAEAALEDYGAAGALPGDDWWYAPLLAARARMRLAQGHAKGAIEDMQVFVRLAERIEIDPGFHPIFSWLALAHDAVGEHAEAQQMATRELADARAFGLPRRTGIALRALGLIEGGATGLKLLRESVDVLEPSPAQLEYLRSVLEYGAALRRANHRAEARVPLRAALDGARRSGALAVARRAHEELAATGEKLRPLAADGAGALTPSERRVAELAARGQTNREIAQGLFLSVKTVETHLSSVYRKLDVPSRRDLAAALAA